jgi:hypothetical protein
MTNLLAGIGLGGMASMAILTAEVVGYSTSVPLGDAAKFGIATCAIVWRFGRNFQHIKDGQKQQSKDIHIVSRRICRVEGRLGLSPFDPIAPDKETSTIP